MATKVISYIYTPRDLAIRPSGEHLQAQKPEEQAAGSIVQGNRVQASGSEEA
jgi:hypothetical protein